MQKATGSSLSVQQLLDMVTAEPSTDSNTIKVEVTGPDPQEAATLADAFANQMILQRRESDEAALVTARQALEAQVAMMTPTDLLRARPWGSKFRRSYEQLEDPRAGADGRIFAVAVGSNPQVAGFAQTCERRGGRVGCRSDCRPDSCRGCRPDG